MATNYFQSLHLVQNHTLQTVSTSHIPLNCSNNSNICLQMGLTFVPKAKEGASLVSPRLLKDRPRRSELAFYSIVLSREQNTYLLGCYYVPCLLWGLPLLSITSVWGRRLYQDNHSVFLVIHCRNTVYICTKMKNAVLLRSYDLFNPFHY